MREARGLRLKNPLSCKIGVFVLWLEKIGWIRFCISSIRFLVLVNM